MTADQANANVTAAIFKAEHALDDAITAWEAVEKAEHALCLIGEEEGERFIASRGYGRAITLLDVLRALRGRG